MSPELARMQNVERSGHPLVEDEHKEIERGNFPHTAVKLNELDEPEIVFELSHIHPVSHQAELHIARIEAADVDPASLMEVAKFFVKHEVDTNDMVDSVKLNLVNGTNLPQSIVRAAFGSSNEVFLAAA
jgi:hypothetical protein